VIEILEFQTYDTTVPAILNQAGADQLFAAQACILLKPNLVNASVFPVTTSPDLCRPIIEYIQECSAARLILAEGCGDSVYETTDLFQMLGYDTLAKEFGIELMDLNHEPSVKLTDSQNPIFTEFYLPEIALNSFIVSLPVLKAHSLAAITGTLKNMMGFAPPRHYSGTGPWKKASFHAHMQDAIMGLCSYRVPDLSILDASVGLADYHLGGPTCDPPVNKIVISDDPFKLDQCAASLLGIHGEQIAHIHKKNYVNVNTGMTNR
jgi:uncharacterized protein (DUF362 family)